MARAGEAVSFSNIAATTAPFVLRGGEYGVSCTATFSAGTVKLQRLAGDGVTYVSVSAATDFAAAGYSPQYLPAGTYRWTIATATAVYAEVVRIPGD
jgi:hypothetical protein